MPCDMCGAEEELFLTKIEGTHMNVCQNCSKYGTVIKKIGSIQEEEPKKRSFNIYAPKPAVETVQMIVSDYGKVIKEKRESMGLKQKELAKVIAEKESVIHKLESGHMEPNLDLARKLEKFLSIKLIEEQEIGKTKTTASNSKKVTVGDIIRIKKR